MISTFMINLISNIVRNRLETGSKVEFQLSRKNRGFLVEFVRKMVVAKRIEYEEKDRLTQTSALTFNQGHHLYQSINIYQNEDLSEFWKVS